MRRTPIVLAVLVAAGCQKSAPATPPEAQSVTQAPNKPDPAPKPPVKRDLLEAAKAFKLCTNFDDIPAATADWGEPHVLRDGVGYDMTWSDEKYFVRIGIGKGGYKSTRNTPDDYKAIMVAVYPKLGAGLTERIGDAMFQRTVENSAEEIIRTETIKSCWGTKKLK